MFEKFRKAEIKSTDRLPWLVVSGAFWVGFLQILTRIFSLVRILILARLLAPDDFGLFGMAAITLSAIESFSKIGIEQALIQKKGDIKPYLNTAWTMQIIRGLTISAVLFLISSPIAAFFNEPRAELIIQAIAIVSLLRAFRNVGIYGLNKEMDFKKVFLYESSGTIADLVISVGAAVILRDVWAIVYGLLAKEFLLLISSYLLANTKLKLSIDKAILRELYHYGKYIFIQAILFYLLLEGDDIFVGKVLGTEMLGYYQMAFIISNLSATEISHVISKVFLPAYSKIQDDLTQIGRVLVKTVNITSMLSLPLAAGLFVIAPEVVENILGSKWLPIVTVTQILCLFGAMRSVGSAIGPIFLAIGKVGIPVKISFVQLLLLAIIIYPLTLKWGLAGTAIAVSLSMLVALVSIIYSAANIIKIESSKLILPILKNLGATLGMCVSLVILKLLLTPTIINLTVIVLAGIIVYSGLIWWMQKGFLKLIFNIYQ